MECRSIAKEVSSVYRNFRYFSISLCRRRPSLPQVRFAVVRSAIRSLPRRIIGSVPFLRSPRTPPGGPAATSYDPVVEPDIPAADEPEVLQQVFERIYEERVWTDALPGMPRSGRGSLYERSLPVVEFVQSVIADGTVGSIVDVGCGDLTYLSKIEEITSGQVDYLGFDIVPALVEEHRLLPWGRFEVADATAPDFSVEADLVLVKDVLFHLTNEQAVQVLANLKASTWKLLLLTSTANESNDDRVFDWWHYAPLNLTLPPFSLQPWQSLPRTDGGNYLVLRPDDLRL